MRIQQGLDGEIRYKSELHDEYVSYQRLPCHRQISSARNFGLECFSKRVPGAESRRQKGQTLCKRLGVMKVRQLHEVQLF
jgi:hypothetical protein